MQLASYISCTESAVTMHECRLILRNKLIRFLKKRIRQVRVMLDYLANTRLAAKLRCLLNFLTVFNPVKKASAPYWPEFSGDSSLVKF
jgi:hypothetical protein